MGEVMKWIVGGIAVAVLLALMWFTASRPESGPGDRLARKYRERGGNWGGGGWGGGPQ